MPVKFNFGRKFLALLFGLIIINLVSFLLFRTYLQSASYEIMSGWLNSENINIQQGNLLTAVTRTQGILLSSNVVSGVNLVGFNEKGKPTSLVAFGVEPELDSFPSLEPNKIELERLGVFGARAQYRISGSNTFLIVMDFYSQKLLNVFLFYSLLLCALFYASWYSVQKIEKTEATERESILNEAINSLIQNDGISDVLRLRMPNLVNRWSELSERLEESKQREAKNLSAIKVSEMASQVSHDIRSPLSALNMILGALDQISEEKRILIRNSVQRINDIANQLLQISRKQKEKGPTVLTGTDPIILMPSLVDYLISEKRVQFREKPSVHIEADLSQSYGLFAHIDPTEIKRVLSNLVNNSVEAFDSESGKITVALRDCGRNAAIMVIDNGKGIPASILAKLGEKGVSQGKESTQSGSGLGVFHAKQTIEQFKGQFTIESKEGRGTIITMTIPKAMPPKWFVEKLEITPNQHIVVLDDDISIHNIWRGRLQSIDGNTHGVSLISFTSGDEFKSWVSGQPENVRKEILFLIDYELLNQSQTGLDLIEELKIKAILVTSRFEEKAILNRCERLGVGLVPKGMAGVIPIKIVESKTHYDWVLIDDDPLVHMTWKMAAMDRKKKVFTFSDYDGFARNASQIDLATAIFIDANLAKGIRGEDIAEKIAHLGFKKIYIATGYNAEDIRQCSAILAVVGKEPPA